MVNKKWLRISVPALIIVVWLGLAGLGGPTFGKLSSVTSNDQASFLPASAESTRVQAAQSKFFEGNAIPAIVVIEADKPIVGPDLQAYGEIGRRLSDVKGLQKAPGGEQGLVVGPIPSQDQRAVEYIVPIADSHELKAVAADLRAAVNEGLPSGAKAYVTGPAGLSADLAKAFGGIDSILLLVAAGAVFIILLLVYRAVLLPFLVLFTAMAALCGAILVVFHLAKNGIIDLNGQSQGILSILVIGAATDYSLLLVARYREALSGGLTKWPALWAALKGSFEPILASAATVALALLCLLFSDLNSNRSLGPIAAIGIATAFVATLTLLPALLVAFGRVAFWPLTYGKQANVEPAKIVTGTEELRGSWAKAGRLVSARPRLVWIVTASLLAICSLGLLQLKASGVAQTDLILAQSEAVDGQAVLAKHFSAGSGAPVIVIAPQDRADEVIARLKSNEKITDVAPFTGAMQTFAPAQPKVVDGAILINASLKTQPYSNEAENTVRSLRQDLAAIDQRVLVGGTTALNLDSNTTAEADLVKIVPLVLLVILLVLIVLMRSLVAPLLLVATVVLSFGATLGISALVFNHLFHFPGADPAVPLFGFVFLVALGIDYNIFLMTRAREEAFRYGTRPAMLHSLGKTGGVITSAGIVLAATFAALGIIPILFLAQIAFIVAFGVLVDTILVRSLLVPALIYDCGRRAWWPAHKPS